MAAAKVERAMSRIVAIVAGVLLGALGVLFAVVAGTAVGVLATHTYRYKTHALIPLSIGFTLSLLCFFAAREFFEVLSRTSLMLGVKRDNRESVHGS
jgi:hypothetical protein